MGLRSPQEMDSVKTQAMPTSRTSIIPKAEISANFLNSFAKAADNVVASQTAQDKRMTALVSARYRELADQQRIASEGEVAKTQGWNVLKVSKEQTSSLQENLIKLKSEFGDQYEPYLENVRLDVMNKYNRSTQPYVTGQVKKTTNDTYNAVIANQMNDTILDSGNIDNFSENLERVKALVKERGEVQHGDDLNAEIAPGMKLGELIEKETTVAASKTVANSVIQLAKMGHLKNAEELFRKHDPDMTADDRLRAAEAMKSAVNAEDGKSATALADLVQKTANDMVEAERMISDQAPSDKVRNSAMAIIKNRFDIATKAKKKKDDETTATVYQNLAAGKDISQLQDLMRGLPVERQNEIVNTLIKNNGKVVPVLTDNKKFDEALDRIYKDPTAVEDPGFMAKYIPHLSPNDYAFVEGQYVARKRQAVDNQAWNKNNVGKIILDDVTRFNNEMGIFNQSMISKNKRIAVEYGQTLLEQNPKMDQVELTKKVKAFLYTNSAMPQVKERGIISKAWNNLFGDGLDYEVNYKNPQAPDAINSAGQPITYTPEDMDAYRNAAKKAFEAQGKPVDMQHIEKALRDRMNRGDSIKVK
jgi:hypothetical protein